MEDKYLIDLEEDQKAALEECLRTFDLDELLGILYEFIETHVKYSEDNEIEVVVSIYILCQGYFRAELSHPLGSLMRLYVFEFHL